MAKKKTMTQIALPEMSAYCRSLSIILESGITCEEAVLMLCDNEEGAVSVVAGRVREHFQYSLAEALKKAGGFPDYMVQMVEAGEAAGRLDEVLGRLAVYFDQMDAAERRVKSAVMYPSAALCVLSLLLLVLAVKILPVFMDVYRSLSGSLTDSVYITFASAASWAVFSISALLTVLLGGLALLWKSGRRKTVIAWLKRLPAVAACARDMELAAFTSAVSIYTAGAVEAEEAVEAAKQAVSDRILVHKINQCQQKVGEGVGFSRAAYETGLYAPLYGRMLMSSQSAGRETEGLAYTADQTWETAGDHLDLVIQGIEPVLSVVITGCIGILLISVMLPLIGMMNSIG